jgi:hypothetical protein
MIAAANPLIIRFVPIVGSKFCSKPTKISVIPAMAEPRIKLQE